MSGDKGVALVPVFDSAAGSKDGGNMIAVYLAPLYIICNVYFLYRILKWMGACAKPLKKIAVRVLTALVYTFFALSVLIAFLMPTGNARRIMKLISNYWLGVLFYMAPVIFAADVVGLILRKGKRSVKNSSRSSKTLAAVGTVCALVTAVFSIWGVIQARIIRVTPYEITVNKEAEGIKKLKVVLVSDLHLGYNIGVSHMGKMVESINEQNADLVVIAGDIFDNEYEAVEEPEKMIAVLKGIQSKYGVYACYGNHDIQEPILAGFTFGSDEKKMSDDRMDEMLAQADIHLLRDEAVLIADSIYLYGRADAERPGREIDVRKDPEEITADMDSSKPIIVLDHEPRELGELAEAGVDVDLCGHTHDGQMFPANLLVSLMWENSYGYLQKGSMHNIVTSGVGLFGPNMRVGTKAEICPITIYFK